MPTWFQLAQLGLALLIAIVVAERVRTLYVRAAVSDEAQRWLVDTLEAGDRERAREFARMRPDTHAARVLRAVLDGEDTVGEVLLALREETLARLALLRVAATVASTIGLLGGILTLARGSVPRHDLAALSAGGAQRLTISESLTTMAIGVATSAFCFQALALFKRRAQRQLAQSARMARAAELSSGPPSAR